MSKYKPIEIKTLVTGGMTVSLEAMRLPMRQRDMPPTWMENLELASRLIKGGDSHAKCMRGVKVWFEIQMGIGFMLEWDTYRIGIDCLSSSSQMHTNLKGMKGEELAEKKQQDLPDVYYKRMFVANYQSLRNMYLQRLHHRHPDWQKFCRWVETLPQFSMLIYPEVKNAK